MTPAEAWDLGYAEDAWFLDEFGQYLPAGMIHNRVRHDRDLTFAFVDGAMAHTNDARYRQPRTPNPHKEVKS